MSHTLQSFKFGRFEVRSAQRSVLADGSPLPVGARAFDVLVALIERRDRVVGGEELFELAWPGLVVEENNLRQQVAALRKLFGVDAVITVPGRGYRFGLVLDDGRAPGAAAAPAPHVPAVPNNLPVNLPTLIGREAELACVLELGCDAPVLTLVGAGGVGKTRLALAVADHVKSVFKDGAWFVELAPLADPELLTRVVASALDVHEEQDRPLLDTLLDFLRNAELLIVLDNCEHLVEASARWVERVLQGSAGVRVLATSREPLSIAGERVWRVLSLRTPAPDESLSAEQLMAYAAARLFVERATAAEPAFRLTAANAPAVVSICHQLDGIPLALELAAARVKAMRVEQVADRLHDRFALLTRGSRTALARHQTLRSLIDWSHDLLSEPERILLRRLSVFAGSWTLEAAELVCSDGCLAKADVLELLAKLVEKSLVLFDGQAADPRYRMLETIRQYGLEKLGACQEREAMRAAHLSQLVGFAEGVQPRLLEAQQLLWEARVKAELDNIRVALEWALQSDDPGTGLRLLNALHRYWYKNMHWGEVTGWQARLAQRFDQLGLAPTADLARSFYVAGMLAAYFDPPAGRRLAERCLLLSRGLGFDEGIAWGLLWLGHLDTRKRDPCTRHLFADALDAGRRIADPWRQAFVLANCSICFANYEALMGRDDSAQDLLAQCEMQIARFGDDPVYVGYCRSLQATMASRSGDLPRASALVAESLALRRAVDSKADVAGSLSQLGLIALSEGQAERALGLFRESLPLHRNYPTSQWVTKGLAHVLIAYAACGRWQLAARLAGALCGPDRAPDAAPPELSGRVAQAYEQAITAVRAAIGIPAFDAQADAAKVLTREQAISLALDP